MESNFVNKYVTSVLRELKIRKALDTTKEGAMFVDFEVEYNGKMQRLSDYVGKGQYVLVDFWASWCTPCRMEIPNLVNIYNKYKNKGLAIYQVCADMDKTAWATQIKDQGLEWVSVCDPGNVSRTLDLYNIRKIPALFIIDKNGDIVEKDLFDPAKLEKAVARLVR
ncbi:MAG: TlpA family protein disulfide reductase [Bacteroidales bacterium]|nr:TlpA family protein disulfide reductase [Bacteroidales bacterium]